MRLSEGKTREKVMNIRKFLLAASTAGIALLPTCASAVVGAYLGEKGFSEQTQNAADALESALAAAATKGESVRGASGALGQIALNSGNLICDSWIIGFKLRIQKMHQDAVYNPDLDPLIQKAEDFVAKLEANCARVGFMGPTPPQGGGVVAGGGKATGGGKGTGGGTGGGGIPGGTGGVSDGPGAFTPTPGSTIADEICRRNCADKKEAMQQAVNEFELVDGIAKRANDGARNAEKAAVDAESKQASLSQELANLEKNGPVAGQSLQVQVAWNNARNKLKSSLKEVSNALPGLKKTAAEQRRIADTLLARSKELKLAADSATAAYNECVRIWRSKANGACQQDNAVRFSAGGAPAAGSLPAVKSSANENHQPNSESIVPHKKGGEVSPLSKTTGSVQIPVTTPQDSARPNLRGYYASQMQTPGNVLTSVGDTVLKTPSQAPNGVSSGLMFNSSPANMIGVAISGPTINIAKTMMPEIPSKPRTSKVTVNPGPAGGEEIQTASEKRVGTISSTISGAVLSTPTLGH
jgi:hypothetical protein